MSVNLFGPRPALGGTKNNHRPARTSGISSRAGMLLDRTNLQNALLQCRSHLLVHRKRLVAFDEVRFVAVSDQKRFQLIMRNAREDCRIRDLVAIEVQHRQDRSITNRIEEFVRMPRRRERPGLSLADPRAHFGVEIGIHKGGSVSVRYGIAKLPTFVNGTRRLWRAMRADASRKRELP